jgi:hypothetical protein
MVIIYLFLSALVITGAAMAYSVRVRRRLLYGITEIGYRRNCGISVFLSLTNQRSVSTIIGMAGGIYIVVRGFDNVNAALKDDSKWRRVFDRVINFFGKDL